MKLAILSVALLTGLGACATQTAAMPETEAPSGVVETVSTDDILQQQVIIEAPDDQVWDAFTTSEGYMAWASPFAVIDFGVGGQIEASYEPDGAAGRDGNIVIEILAYLPEEMLVLKTVKAPPGFASQETLDRLVSVFEFEPLQDGRTKVTVSGVGYGDDEESNRLRNFFIEGNTFSLMALNDRFVIGPTDWAAMFANGG